MSQLIIRHGTRTEGGLIHHDEEPTTFEIMQSHTTMKLDRRKSYCLINGIVCEDCSFIRTCSGCHETEDGQAVGEYEWDAKHQIELGSGCSECGYQGKVWDRSWMPVNPADMDTFMNSEEDWEEDE